MKHLASSFYLVSGFHRSGTSAIAKTLSDNGVDMGQNLMGASFANPAGHVEDLPLVNIHDAMLASCGKDWRCHDAVQLSPPEFLTTRLRQYVESRIADGKMVGAKDPRAVHFLNSWLKATNQSVKSIFLVRDWRYSVSSLLKRHSRDLLNTTSEMAHRQTDLSFWQYPDLGAKMWLASSKAILAWYRFAPEDTLILPFSAFQKQKDALFEIADAKGFNADIFKRTSSYSDSLLQSSIPQSFIEMLSPSVIKACDEMLSTLYDNSKGLHSDEQCKLTPVHGMTRELHVKISKQDERDCSPFFFPAINYEQFSIPEIVELIKQLPEQERQRFNWQSLLSRQDITAKDLEAIFVISTKYGQLDTAEAAVFRLLQRKEAAWRWMHLGDIYVKRKLIPEAERCFSKARQMAPTNSTFLARLADIEIYKGNILKARALIDEAVALDPNKPAINLAKQRLQQATAEKKDAITSPAVMPVIHNYQDVVDEMTKDYNLGKLLDDYVVRSAFVSRNNLSWLSKGLEDVTPSARICFIDYMLAHLSKYWSQIVLQTELLAAPAFETYPLDTSHQINSDVKIGVHIHVFYVELLAEILEFLANLPYSPTLVVTYPTGVVIPKKSIRAHFPNTHFIPTQNRGRDIAPWLIHAVPLLQDCDLVLKLHTKSSSHSSHLVGWRLQLIWSLLGSRSIIEETIDKFIRCPQLGLVSPPYHTGIVSDIGWGSNKPLCDELATKMNISLSTNHIDFAAGSMFWYKPKAIRKLTDLKWDYEDFPDESGQIDGTIMHAIERIIVPCIEADNFRTDISQPYPK
ncbi:rhamnan synthesis F family protein [Aestuariibacter sp. A3R04]|uniref:rhamnan synthesis F family protein n=1 Tax=Aestuariibacter sp. A3R04 TaxID=2841571 RepID=UPI001C08178E|nr:hypothetical protein [Aestuariibacter sp. A3R04]